MWKDDLLWYKDHLYLVKSSKLKKKVLFEFHSSLIGGHSGFLKIYHRVKKDFFGMVLKLMFKNLWQNAWFANKIKWKQLRPLVSYNHFPFQANGVHRYRWILPQVYPSFKKMVPSWRLLIDLLNMHTLFTISPFQSQHSCH